MEKILDPKFLPYLIFSIIYSFFSIWFVRENTLRKALKLNIPFWVGKAITIISAILLIISLMDEIGLFLNEWLIFPRFFSYLRVISSFPGISYLVYFANYSLLVPLVYQIIEKNRGNTSNEEKNTLMKLQSVNASITMLTFSFIITSMQLASVNEDGNIFPWILPAVILSICSFVIIFSNRKIAKKVSQFKDQNDGRNNLLIGLLIIGIVLLQTMITKAGLLLAIFYWVRNLLVNFIAFLKRKNRPQSSQSVFVETLARHLIPTEWKDLIPTLILFSSVVPIIIFWQIDQSPFPPSGGFFYKDTTINLMYTLDILLFLIAIIAKHGEWILTIAATFFLVFSRYVSIILFPNWYSNGFYSNKSYSFLDFVTELVGKGVIGAALVCFVLHTLSFMLFCVIFANSKYAIESLFDKDQTKIRPYFISSICCDWVIVTFGFFIQLFFYFPLKDLYQWSSINLVFCGLGYFLCVIAFASMIYTDWLGEPSRTRLFFININKFYGEKRVEKLYRNIPLARHYSLQKIRGVVNYRHIPIIVLIISSLGFMILIVLGKFLG